MGQIVIEVPGKVERTFTTKDKKTATAVLVLLEKLVEVSSVPNHEQDDKGFPNDKALTRAAREAQAESRTKGHVTWEQIKRENGL